MSSTRFRKRDEALGAVMRDMVTAKYVAEAAGAPHSPKGSQVERCGQYGPLGRHVCQTSQEEPRARLLLLDNPEHRLNQLLSQLVRLFSCRGGHPSAVAPQCRIVRPDGYVAAILALRAHSKGRARSADDVLEFPVPQLQPPLDRHPFQSGAPASVWLWLKNESDAPLFPFNFCCVQVKNPAGDHVASTRLGVTSRTFIATRLIW